MDIIRPSINENKESFTPDGVIISNCTLSDNGDIVGFTSDNVKAKYIYSKNKWFFGSEIGYSNLIPLTNNRDKARELGSIGGKKAQENREQKKNINEIAKSMLEQAMSNEQITAILGDKKELLIDNSVASVLVGAMVKSALEGSFKAFEAVRDTAGYKPATKTEVDLSAEIMTESDKMLIDKVSKVG